MSAVDFVLWTYESKCHVTPVLCIMNTFRVSECVNMHATRDCMLILLVDQRLLIEDQYFDFHLMQSHLHKHNECRVFMGTWGDPY